MKVSVVLGTFNRSEYLERSLHTYLHSSFDPHDLEIIVIDDWSTDSTEPMCMSYAHELNLIYIRPTHKQPDYWRDSASIINLGIRASHSDFIIATHPEMMVGHKTLETLYNHRQDMTWHTTKTYFLSCNQQKHLQDIDWRRDLLSVRQLPNFYTEDPFIQNTNDVYSHRNMETLSDWGSWQFAGMTRNTWKTQGGLYESDHWGLVDVCWLMQRNALGIRNQTEMDEQTYCVHQNHDAPGIEDHRDMSAVIRNIPNFTTETAHLNNLWELA